MCENEHTLPSSSNETVTLIALPLHLFQQATQNPLVVEQNVLLKSLPDGSLVIDTDQLYNGSESISLVTNNENSATKKDEGTTQVKNKITSPKVSPSDKTKPKVRYINCKTSPEASRRPGRPKKQKPGDKGPFKCKTCDKEFDKWILYKRHEKAHLNEKKFKCGNCSASYNILSNYLLHVATHDTTNPTCPECGKKFQRVASLKAHLMYHEKEETFYCQDCDSMFNSDIELNNHLTDHCTEKKLSTNSLQCRFCQYKFTVQSEYKKHMSEHNKMRSILNVTQRKKNRKNLTSERRHVCSHCKKMFQKHSQLERHMRVHSGEKPFVCTVCNRGFSQKGTLQIHMVKHNGLKPHKCSFCPAKFSQKGNLRAHILKTHSVPRPGENVYSCTECSCVFKKLGSLNAHTTRNHPETKDEDIKSMISQLVAMQNNMSVDKDILQQAILRSELNSDVQNEEKNTSSYATFADLGLDGQMRRYIIKQRRAGDTRWHQCTFCCKEFRKPSDLVRHIRIHTREKPFKCKICPRSFAVKSTLTAHLRTHNGARDYHCVICSKVFRSLNSLNVHLKLHSTQKPHPILSKNLHEPIIITNKGLQTVDVPLKKRPISEAGSKSRPYCCTTCGACFRNLSHLKQHNLMHSGERNYRCSQCLRNFTSGGILKAHMLTHNKTKLYSCQPCNKQFTTNGSLRRHLESHSTSRPVICPYCYKNFKTVVTCRRHIKTHKSEPISDMKEDFPPKINDLPYPPDLDALTDDSFNLTPIISEPPETQTLQADKTGTVVLPLGQETLTQENIREIEDTLNNQMLNIIGNENFIDTSVYEKVPSMATTDELVSTLTGDPKIDDSQLYQTVFVNFVKTQFDNGFDINNINNLVLSQLKFQNESLFLTDLSTLNINDGNVLLPFQLTTQMEQQNELLIPQDLDQNNVRSVENPLDPIDPNLQLKLSQANIFMTDPDSNLILNNDIIQNDYLNNDEQLEENIQNITIVTDDSENPESQLPLIPIVSLTDMPTYSCNVCKVQFKTERQLKTHHCYNLVNVEEIVKNDNVKVDYGSEINGPVEQEKDNQIEVNETQEQVTDTMRLEEKSTPLHKNQCTFCPKSFRKPSDLQRHLRTHTGERPFKCNECAKCFSLKSTLEGHQKIHQGVKNCLCPVCNALFATKSSLKIHMRLHTGSKPFKCNLCPVKFRTSGHLKAHLIVHYKEAIKTGKVPEDIVTRKAKMTTIIDASAQEVTETEKCIDHTSDEYTEITLENVQEHFEQFNTSDALIIDAENQVLQFELPSAENLISLNTNNILTDENGQKQNITTGILDDKARQQIETMLNKNVNVEKKDPAKKCEVCNKKFQSKYFLDRHMKIHTGERSYTCEFCSKKFNQKSALEAHKRIHLGSRPYDCPYCSNTFSQRGNLKTHIKRIHLNKITEQNFTENSDINPVFINILPPEMYPT